MKQRSALWVLLGLGGGLLGACSGTRTATGGEGSETAALGCQTDNDCKGDRICENRECINPEDSEEANATSDDDDDDADDDSPKSEPPGTDDADDDTTSDTADDDDTAEPAMTSSGADGSYSCEDWTNDLDECGLIESEADALAAACNERTESDLELADEIHRCTLDCIGEQAGDCDTFAEFMDGDGPVDCSDDCFEEYVGEGCACLNLPNTPENNADVVTDGCSALNQQIGTCAGATQAEIDEAAPIAVFDCSLNFLTLPAGLNNCFFGCMEDKGGESCDEDYEADVDECAEFADTCRANLVGDDGDSTEQPIGEETSDDGGEPTSDGEGEGEPVEPTDDATSPEPEAEMTTDEGGQTDTECRDGGWARCLCDQSLEVGECTPTLQQTYYDNCVSGESPAIRCMAEVYIDTETAPGLTECLQCYSDG